MNHIVDVQGKQSFANALHYRFPLFVSELALHLENVVKLATGTVLHYQVYVNSVGEDSVELDNVDVLEKGLNDYFPSQLVLELFSADGLLLDGLNCTQKPCYFMSE